MVKALFDSNILIDALNGINEARVEMAYYSDAAISAITLVEVSVKLTATQRTAFRAFLNGFPIKIVHTDDIISDLAITIRSDSLAVGPKIPLPDAIIGATAISQGRTVVTRNARDFGASQVRVPYRLEAGVVSDVQPAPT